MLLLNCLPADRLHVIVVGGGWSMTKTTALGRRVVDDTDVGRAVCAGG